MKKVEELLPLVKFKKRCLEKDDMRFREVIQVAADLISDEEKSSVKSSSSFGDWVCLRAAPPRLLRC
jgi:hypothetical protein